MRGNGGRLVTVIIMAALVVMSAAMGVGATNNGVMTSSSHGCELSYAEEKS